MRIGPYLFRLFFNLMCSSAINMAKRPMAQVDITRTDANTRWSKKLISYPFEAIIPQVGE